MCLLHPEDFKYSELYDRLIGLISAVNELKQSGKIEE